MKAKAQIQQGARRPSCSRPVLGLPRPIAPDSPKARFGGGPADIERGEATSDVRTLHPNQYI